MSAMFISGKILEKEERDRAEGKGPRVGLSPAALKRKLAAKKAKARAEKDQS